MEVAQPYTAADVPAWESRLKAAVAAYRERFDQWTASGQGDNPDNGEVRHAKLTLEMLKAGLSVRHQNGNLVLNELVVLSSDGRRWRRRGLQGWKASETLDDALGQARTGSPADVSRLVPSMETTASRYESLRWSLGLKEPPFQLPEDAIEAFEAVQALADEYERQRADGTLGPTAKQARYADDIAKLLGIEVPAGLNRATAKTFITNHLPAFEAKRAELRGTANSAPEGERQSSTKKPKLKGRSKARDAAEPRADEHPTTAPAPQPTSPPDYSRQKAVKVPPDVLAKLGVASVEEMVARVNDLRVLAKRPFVARSQFPTTMIAFTRLAAEIRALPQRDAPSDAGRPPPQAPGPETPAAQETPILPDLLFGVPEASPPLTRPPGGEAAAAPAAEPDPEFPYDPDTPLIDFVVDNLGILPPAMARALDRRFYVTGSWKGYDALARELGTDAEEAMGILEEAWQAFGRKTGCWAAIRKVVLDSGLPLPVTVGELQEYDWDSGLPEDVILLILEKAAGVRVTSVDGHGEFLLRLDENESHRLHRSLKHNLPQVTNATTAAVTLKRLQQSFDGRIDEALRRIVEKAARSALASADKAQAQPHSEAQSSKSLH